MDGIKINISNLGPIKNAKITIRPFTVIAGPNGSGKSFVTKVTYSFLKSLSEKHLLEAVRKTHSLCRFIKLLDSDIASSPIKNVLDEILEVLSDGILNFNEFWQYKFQMAVARDIANRLRPSSEYLRKSYHRAVMSDVKDKESHSMNMVLHLCKSLDKLLEDLSYPEEGIKRLTEEYLKNELLENFQVNSVNKLLNSNASYAEVSFYGIGNVIFSDQEDNQLRLNITNSDISHLRELYPIVYIESPIYWKLRRALSEQASERRRDSRLLTGVPKYFSDLNDMVTKELKVIDSPIINVGEIISNHINGKLTVTDKGEINFISNNTPNDNGGVSLTLTASGVINLGVIQLLIEKGIICKGSCLFIDEPELNLHPAWQKILIEVLFKLSQEGVKVVMTTHSIDIMKTVELLVRENPELIDIHFGINQLSVEGRSINIDKDALEKIASIQIDLSEPFNETFFEIESL